MRRNTKKRAKRNRKAKPIRDQLKEEVGMCEICGHDPRRKTFEIARRRLEVHEIARGPAREQAQDKRFAILVVCYPCHEDTNSGVEAEAKQLACLKLSRPDDYDLPAYNLLKGRGPNRVAQSDVDVWLART